MHVLGHDLAVDAPRAEALAPREGLGGDGVAGRRRREHLVNRRHAASRSGGPSSRRSPRPSCTARGRTRRPARPSGRGGSRRRAVGRARRGSSRTSRTVGRRRTPRRGSRKTSTCRRERRRPLEPCLHQHDREALEQRRVHDRHASAYAARFSSSGRNPARTTSRPLPGRLVVAAPDQDELRRVGPFRRRGASRTARRRPRACPPRSCRRRARTRPSRAVRRTTSGGPGRRNPCRRRRLPHGRSRRASRSSASVLKMQPRPASTTPDRRQLRIRLVVKAGHQHAALRRDLRAPERRAEEVRREDARGRSRRPTPRGSSRARATRRCSRATRARRRTRASARGRRRATRRSAPVARPDLEPVHAQAVLDGLSRRHLVLPARVVDRARRRDLGAPARRRPSRRERAHEHLGAADGRDAEPRDDPQQAHAISARTVRSPGCRRGARSAARPPRRRAR